MEREDCDGCSEGLQKPVICCWADVHAHDPLYLYSRHPEQADVEDAVGDEAGQVESQEVEVETYNTENTQC